MVPTSSDHESDPIKKLFWILTGAIVMLGMPAIVTGIMMYVKVGYLETNMININKQLEKLNEERYTAYQASQDKLLLSNRIDLISNRVVDFLEFKAKVETLLEKNNGMVPK